MLISGGHVIGINKVKVNKDQFKGDGIWTELSIEPYVDNKINDIKNYINNNFYLLLECLFLMIMIKIKI